jgi:FkbM family methyltransferase
MILTNPKFSQEYESHRQQAFHATSTEAALRKLSLRGHAIETIVDIGASDGSWSKVARTFWPECKVLLVDANPFWENRLREFMDNERQADYVLAAAGSFDGMALFHNTPNDPFSGAVVSHETTDSFQVPQIAIDSEIERRGLKGPFLLKFDTHGYERDILRGAASTLLSTDIIVMEMYLFQTEEKRFPAMCALLEDAGFRCVDICELLYRDYDFSLWQFDAVFVRADAPELQVGTYAA